MVKTILLAILVCIGFGGCGPPDRGGVHRFQQVFGFELPYGVTQTRAKGSWSDDPRFSFEISQDQFAVLASRAYRAGYGPFVEVVPGRTYDYGSFHIAGGGSQGTLLVAEWRPNGPGDDVYYLFYRPRIRQLHAVSFLNH